MLQVDRHDIRRLPLDRRRAILEDAITGAQLVLPVRRLESRGTRAWRTAERRGLEGFVPRIRPRRTARAHGREGRRRASVSRRRGVGLQAHDVVRLIREARIFAQRYLAVLGSTNHAERSLDGAATATGGRLPRGHRRPIARADVAPARPGQGPIDRVALPWTLL